MIYNHPEGGGFGCCLLFLFVPGEQGKENIKKRQCANPEGRNTLPLYLTVFSPCANKLPTNRSFLQIYRKSKNPLNGLFKGFFIGCGGRTRTYDLRVMSPTSYHLLHSAIFGHPQRECLIIISQSDGFVNLFFEKETEKVTVFIAVSAHFLAEFAKYTLITIRCHQERLFLTNLIIISLISSLL